MNPTEEKITPPPDLSGLTLAELQSRYDLLYREKFAPTLRSYSAMAAEALALQVAIYKWQLAGFGLRTLPKILTFHGKESPGAFNKMILTLQEQNITVTEVIYDPARQEFHLFGNPTA